LRRQPRASRPNAPPRPVRAATPRDVLCACILTCIIPHLAAPRADETAGARADFGAGCLILPLRHAV
jgi:hypothetical protein